MVVGTAVAGVLATQVFKLMLWGIGFFMKRAAIRMEAKEAFHKYIVEMGKQQLVPASLKEESERQIDELFKMKEADGKK